MVSSNGGDLGPDFLLMPALMDAASDFGHPTRALAEGGRLRWLQAPEPA
jgi:hypothetical protein